MMMMMMMAINIQHILHPEDPTKYPKKKFKDVFLTAIQEYTLHLVWPKPLQQFGFQVAWWSSPKILRLSKFEIILSNHCLA